MLAVSISYMINHQHRIPSNLHNYNLFQKQN